MTTLRPLVLVLACQLAAGCGQAGQRPVSYPLYAAGAAGTATAGAWEVRLTAARVALGPIYLCATEGASMSLCPVAVGEFAAVAVVDALAPAPQPLGMIEGTTGHVGSVTYDLGISWFPRFKTPQPAPEAPAGHSARFEGTATRGATVLSFLADVDVVPSFAGTRAVQGMRTGPLDITGGDQRLDVRLDPGRLFSGVDFDELAALGGDPVTIPPDSRAYNALVVGLSTTAAPSFLWSPLPN